MNLLTIGAIFFVLILGIAIVLHTYNITRVYKRITSLSQHRTVSLKTLYREMTIAQGSNFSALALTSWILLFVAAAYLYLLVPTTLPYSYMQIPEAASNPAGFLFFGAIIAVITILIILGLDMLPENYRGLKLTELYTFYIISKRTKKLICFTILPLCVSIGSSAYIGTIYPIYSSQAEILALGLLILSMILLVMPVYKETWEGIK